MNTDLVSCIKQHVSAGSFSKALHHSRMHGGTFDYQTLESIGSQAVGRYHKDKINGIFAVDFCFALAIETTHTPYLLQHVSEILDDRSDPDVCDRLTFLFSYHDMYVKNESAITRSSNVISELKKMEPTTIVDFMQEVYHESETLDRISAAVHLQFDLSRYLVQHRQIMSRQLKIRDSFPDLVLADYMGLVHISQARRMQLLDEQRYLHSVRLNPVVAQKEVRIAQMKKDLAQLIKGEDYEGCAALRDKITYYDKCL